MKILNSYWFNGGGIIRVETDYGGIKYYIGAWGPLGGTDQKQDAGFIANWGNTFPNVAGDVLFGVK